MLAELKSWWGYGPLLYSTWCDQCFCCQKKIKEFFGNLDHTKFMFEKNHKWFPGWLNRCFGFNKKCVCDMSFPSSQGMDRSPCTSCCCFYLQRLTYIIAGVVKTFVWVVAVCQICCRTSPALISFSRWNQMFVDTVIPLRLTLRLTFLYEGT